MGTRRILVPEFIPKTLMPGVESKNLGPRRIQLTAQKWCSRLVLSPPKTAWSRGKKAWNQTLSLLSPIYRTLSMVIHWPEPQFPPVYSGHHAIAHRWSAVTSRQGQGPWGATWQMLDAQNTQHVGTHSKSQYPFPTADPRPQHPCLLVLCGARDSRRMKQLTQGHIWREFSAAEAGRLSNP